MVVTQYEEKPSQFPAAFARAFPERIALFGCNNPDYMKRICFSLISLCLLISTVTAENSPIRLPIVLGGEEPLDANGKPTSEVGMASKELGVDCEALSNRALGGDPDALNVIVALHFDGGAADMWNETKLRILLRVPPDEATQALMRLAPEDRKELVSAMWEMFKHYNDAKLPEVKASFSQKYEKLLRVTKAELTEEDSSSDAKNPEAK